MGRLAQIVKRTFAAAGLDLRRSDHLDAATRYYGDFEHDELFKSVFRAGVKASGSTHDTEAVHQRLYNAVQFLRYTLDMDGEVAECGVFQGLSSYLFCSYVRLSRPDFKGRGYYVFDSFAGLSEPRPQDLTRPEGALNIGFRRAGAYKGTLETVKATLQEFPEIDYHPGWIPDSFAGIPEKKYKFVHLDLDLYEPIKGSVEYFYPRMVKGGIIVIDEYALCRWPGARQAVDEFCQANRLITPIELTTGNGVIIKK